MRWITVAWFSLVALVSANAQNSKVEVPLPDHFVIGRETFWDFGPPFYYLEILIVRPAKGGTSVTRILLTPPSDRCFAPAKAEISSVSVTESVSGLLDKANPCSIPEKELRRELKRCKHCLTFSGVHVTMQADCGNHRRLIRSDILDRDIYDPNPRTPQHTSWTMRLLSHLDAALGPGVPEKPVFSLPDEPDAEATELDPVVESQLVSGAYNELFPGADEKASQLYRDAHVVLPKPSVQLVSSIPFKPTEEIVPQYPPLARVTHTQGTVSFSVLLDAEANPTLPTFTQGSPLLQAAIAEAVSRWKFPKEAANQLVSVVMEFSLNCLSLEK